MAMADYEQAVALDSKSVRAVKARSAVAAMISN
jgi:hypothetical protein